MTFYRYQSGSLIDEVEIVTNDRGGARAYLHASSQASPERLAQMQASFRAAGWIGTPNTREGKPVLELRGFKKPGDLAQHLASNGFVGNGYSQGHIRDEKKSFAAKMRQGMLRFVGLSYNVGDLAYMTYAISDYHDARKEQKHYEADRSGWLDKKITREIDDQAREIAKKEKIGFEAARSGIGSMERAKIVSNIEKGAFESLKDGVKGGRLNILAGIGYGIGGILLSVYGSRDQSQNEIKAATEKVQRFLLKDGVSLPTDTAAHDITRKQKKGIGQTINDFLGRYPSEALNFTYSFVGLGLAMSSISKVIGFRKVGNMHDAREEMKDIGLGAVTMTSALAGLLIKEKKPLPGEKKRHGIMGVWDWIQEKPLRATGYGYMISTAFHAWATLGKYQKSIPGDPIRKTLVGRSVFVAMNVLAEVLLVFSSKGHGEGVQTDKSTDESVIANAAQIIAHQPASQQAALVERLAGYLSLPEVIGGKSEEVAARLREQLAALKNNPWANRGGVAQEALEPAHAPEIQKETGKPTNQITAATAQAKIKHRELGQALPA